MTLRDPITIGIFILLMCAAVVYFVAETSCSKDASQPCLIKETTK